MSARFNDFRELVSKFNSVGKCGHEIKKGDTIGWYKHGGTYCNQCWEKWKAEVRSEEFDAANNCSL